MIIHIVCFYKGQLIRAARRNFEKIEEWGLCFSKKLEDSATENRILDIKTTLQIVIEMIQM